MGNKRKNKKKMPKSKRKSRQELEKENIQLMVRIEQTEARMDVKYLRKLEKEIRGLRVIIKTKELNIIQKDKKISDQERKLFQYGEKVKKK